jgi:hypothetical protein
MILHLGFKNDVVARDAEVDVSFSYERRYVRCGEENAEGGGARRRGKSSFVNTVCWCSQGYWVIEDKTNIQSIVSPKLDIGP